LIRLKEPAFAPWLNLQLHAPTGCFGQLQELIYGAKPGLNLENLRELELSIPPLAEQRQIVARVDQLMALIDTLEKQQQERDHLAETFAKAVVASLTGTQIAETRLMGFCNL
jgi:type I restriction enzyme S subunit